MPKSIMLFILFFVTAEYLSAAHPDGTAMALLRIEKNNLEPLGPVIEYLKDVFDEEEVVSNLPECYFCNQQFLNQNILAMHQIIHQTNRQKKGIRQCGYCHKSFPNKDILKEHQKEHLCERKYPCNECGRLFHKKSGLEQHKLIHQGIKPLSCSNCGKAFRQQSQLNKHLKKHSDEKLRFCHFCKTTFATQQEAEVHKVKHAKKPFYPCSLCGKHFSQKSNLGRHMKIHEDKIVLSTTCDCQVQESLSQEMRKNDQSFPDFDLPLFDPLMFAPDYPIDLN